MRFAALVAAICSVLVGCGGHAHPTRAGDSRVAKASVITLHDFPPGWSGDDQHLRNSVACDAIQAAMKAANAVLSTDVFSHGGDAQAEFAVYVFPDPARAQQAFRAIAARSMRLCLGARLATAVRDAKTVTHVDHPKTGPETVPAVGDRQTGTHVVIDFANGKLVREFDADLTVVGTSRGLSLGLFVNIGNGFDERLRERLTSIEADRLSHALAQ